MPVHALDQLVLGLNDPEPAVQEWAAKEVEEWTQKYDGQWRALPPQAPGLLAGLLRVAASAGSTRVAQAAAVEAIANLAMEESNAPLLGNEPGLLRHLLGLLSSRRWDMRLAALQALAQLARDDNITSSIAEAIGAPDTVVKLLRSRDKQVQRLATELVFFMAKHRTDHGLHGSTPAAQSVTRSAAEGLVPLLSSDDTNTMSWASGAMWHLVHTGNSAALGVVVAPKTVTRLVTLLEGTHSTEQDTQQAAIFAGLVLAQAAVSPSSSLSALASHPGLVQRMEVLLTKDLPLLADSNKRLIQDAVRLLQFEVIAVKYKPVFVEGIKWAVNILLLVWICYCLAPVVAAFKKGWTDGWRNHVIHQVWSAVDAHYMDVSGSRFNHTAWRRLRDEAWRRSYPDKVAVYSAVRDMLARGVADPYCRFIEPGQYDFMSDVSLTGLNLGTGNEYRWKTGRKLPRGHWWQGGWTNKRGVWVVAVRKGSPADRAGIEQGDQLLKVAGVPTGQLTPFQAATLIAESSSTVELEVSKADGRRVNTTVPGLVVTESSVASGGISALLANSSHTWMLAYPVFSMLMERPGGRQVGRVALAEFSDGAAQRVATALRRLEAAGATKVLLDLRNNPGGRSTEALEVSRLFLEGGVPIVFNSHRSGPADPPLAHGPAVTRLPLTVLVNEHSASASEVVAGALKDNCRAVLVGKRTFGKGTIQTVFRGWDGAQLTITTGAYRTPSGVDVNGNGITPHFGSPAEPAEAEEALEACRLEREKRAIAVA